MTPAEQVQELLRETEIHFSNIRYHLKNLAESLATPSQNNAPDAQEGTLDESSDESRVSMQTFQENAKSGLVVPQSSNDNEPDLNDTDDDEQPSTEHHDPDHTPHEVPLDAPDEPEQGTQDPA